MQNTMEAQNTFNSFPQFSFFLKPVFKQIPYKTVTAEGIFKFITGDYRGNKEATLKLQTITDKKEANKFKCENFDFACFSGTFDRKNEKGLIKHSGLICLDFDNQPNKEKLREKLLADPQLTTVLLFTSPSGTGLKWIVKIDLNQGTHLENFQAIENYIFETNHIKIDSSGKDVARPCFLPHDPECYFNQEQEEKYFDVNNWLPVKQITEQKTIQSSRTEPGKSKGKQKTIDEVVREIETRQIDLTPTQKDWLKAGFALAVGYGESGRNYFQRICKFWNHYDPVDCDKQFDLCLKGKKDGIRKGTFFWMAKEAGIEI
jgi:hypothetical protein